VSRTSCSITTRAVFTGIGAPSQGLSWPELASRLNQDGRLEELHIEHDFTPASPSFPFGAHVAVVEVDIDTGAVELVRLVAVDDAGTLINPTVAAGQVHGGVATGIAQALFEEVLYDEDANLMTANLVKLRLPFRGRDALVRSGRDGDADTPERARRQGDRRVRDDRIRHPPSRTPSSTHSPPSASATSTCQRTASASGVRCKKPPALTHPPRAHITSTA